MCVIMPAGATGESVYVALVEQSVEQTHSPLRNAQSKMAAAKILLFCGLLVIVAATYGEIDFTTLPCNIFVGIVSYHLQGEVYAISFSTGIF